MECEAFGFVNCDNYSIIFKQVTCDASNII